MSSMESKKNYKQIGGSDIIPLDWKVQKNLDSAFTGKIKHLRFI